MLAEGRDSLSQGATDRFKNRPVTYDGKVAAEDLFNLELSSRIPTPAIFIPTEPIDDGAKEEDVDVDLRRLVFLGGKLVRG
jgi:hypothetical protein